MAANEKQRPKRKVPWILGALVLASFVVLVMLQTSNLWKDLSVVTAQDTLILYGLSSLNFFAFVIFGFIFLRSILKLARERRALQLGARIKTRLFVYFAAISLLPIIAMAGFTYLFMNRAIERWFSQIPENALREAKKVEDTAVEEQTARLRETANLVAAAIGTRSVDNAELARLAQIGNLTHVEITDRSGNTLAFSRKHLNQSKVLDLDTALAESRLGRINDAALSDGAGFDVASAELSDGRRLLIVPALRSGENVSLTVNSSLREMDRLKEDNIIVRQIGFLTLGVLTFLLIFASSWTAFYVARGLTVPIMALAKGSDEIAKGNLSHRVDVIAEDELALLVDSFNQMSARLEANSAELSERRRYIEAVLESLPTGVISVDNEGRIGTINNSAIKMLRLETEDLRGSDLGSIVNEADKQVLDRVIARARRIGRAAEQTVIKRNIDIHTTETSADLAVALTATGLPDDGGAVLVIEDLSELITAQRASAWQEVARRMAHEIKNPLTPIQLSAERIARRFSRDSNGNGATDDIHVTDGQTANVIRDGTATIIREVQGLKAMVDEFSQFARLPDAKLELGNINDLIKQVLELYRDRNDGVNISTVLADDLPETMIDAEQLKRVFVNLIDNSVEAFDDAAEDKQITVKTRHDQARDIIIAEVADNGKGIAPANLQRLFQPYFSTKGRGTGLGLAIVQRIVGEHRGKIIAVTNQPHGAKFIIELPIAMT